MNFAMPFRVSSITPTVLIELVENCASNEGANKTKVVIEALSPGPFLPTSRVASVATSGHGCQVKDCVVGIFNSWSLKNRNGTGFNQFQAQSFT